MSDRAVAPRVALRTAVPTVSVRVLLALAGIGSSSVALPGGFVAAGVLVALVAAVRPRSVAPWVLIGLLGAGAALGGPVPGPRLAALIAGVHLVAVLAPLAGALPVRGRLEIVALARPAIAFVAVQVPVQLIALALPLATGAARVPILAALGGAALLVLAVVLARRVATGRT